jgi:WD40 repeat protein
MGKESVSYGGKSSAKDFIIIFLVLVVVGLLVAWFVFGGEEVIGEDKNDNKIDNEGTVGGNEKVIISGESDIFAKFGEVTLDPDIELDGSGEDVDTIAFWEAEREENMLMFVTAKDTDTVEVWKYPFTNSDELKPIVPETGPNSVLVDQEDDLLFIGESGGNQISVYSIPELKRIKVIGKGDFSNDGEVGLALLKLDNGKKRIYATDDFTVIGFDVNTGEKLLTITPPTESLETVLADDYYQLIHVPDEQGGESDVGGTGVHVYDPDGNAIVINGVDNVYGRGDVFQDDEEGIWLYKCFVNGNDTGEGLIVVSDQREPTTDFEFFDRKKYVHLGTLRLNGVGNTDGIAITQKDTGKFNGGIFAAINDDTTTALVSWGKIVEATGLSC